MTLAPPGGAIGPLLLGGSRALWVDGDLQAGRDWFDAAYRVAELADDTAAMATAALGMAGLWLHEQRSTAAAVLVETRLRHALTVVDPQSSLALRLRARLAGEEDYRSGGHADILAVVAEARLADDPVARAEAVNLAHHCLLGPEHGPARHALAQELIEAGLRTDRRSDLLLGIFWRTVDGFLDADPHAERRLAELHELLGQENHLAIGFVVQAMDVMRSIRAGRLEEAEKQATACAERGRVAGDVDATGWFGAHMMSVRWYQGRIAELLPMLREMVNSPTLSVVDHSYVAGLAVAAAAAGDRRQAAGALARLRGRDLAELPRSSSWLVSLYGIVESAHLLGDVETSAAAYELLRPFSGLPMMGSLAVTCFGSVQHALGVAALTVGDPERAVEHLREAVGDNVRIGHWPAATLSRSRLAYALARRGGAGDAAEAERERATAAQEATGLGMVLPGGAEHDEAGSIAAVGVDAVEWGGARGLVACRRRGRFWEVAFGNRRAEVEHSVGMGYLATLLANPGYEVPAVELVVGPGLPSAVTADSAASSAQPILDGAARRAYRTRLSELQDELDELESNNDVGRAARVRTEREWLIAELAAATGLGGQARHFTGGQERARISVTKAIRRALSRITSADPGIGEELNATVQTGLRCSYQPR